MNGTSWKARGRAGATAVAGAALLVGIGGVAATTAYAAEGCEVDYSVAHEWPGGFTANVGITNLGDPVDGWELSWTFPSGQEISQAWNASVVSAGGPATVTDAGYNAAIGTGGTVSFGFNGAFSGENTDPTEFTLNGVACTGEVGPSPTSPPPTTQPPTSPPPTTDPPTTDPPTTDPPPGEDPMEVVAAMEPGWNLGNSLDSVGGGETEWGNPRITQDLIANVADEGFNSIRIPVTWDDHQGGAPDYAIEQDYLDRVEEVVDWALAEDLYVMINVHHDSWIWMAEMATNEDVVMDRFEAIWTQVSDAFQDAPPELMFESVNEPQFDNTSGDAQSIELLDQLNTTFHEIVRGSGGTNADRLLVLPTLHTNGEEQQYLDGLNATIDALDDPNLIATVHYYGFWPFSVNVAGYTTFDDETRQHIVDTFDAVHDAFVANDIPVVIGEYGLLGFDQHVGTIQQGEKLKFFEFANHYAQQTQLTTQLWDNGQHFDRESYTWNDPEFFAMLEASLSGRSGTASADHVYVAQSGSVGDATLTLNPHGTTFDGLRHGDTMLTEGEDYTVSGDQLTLSSDLLADLTAGQGYGVAADLHAEFSQGVPWRISVHVYDSPTVSDSSGSTDSFTIPVEFHGDQLATMEAVYADGGGNAGPHDWTPYKEFSAAFEPDYDAGTIALTSDFFAEVDDDREVDLTFHFWSGETVEYSVATSGGSVTGTTG